MGCACRLKLVVIRCCACSTILALNKKLHFPVDETRLCPYIGFMPLPDAGRLDGLMAAVLLLLQL